MSGEACCCRELSRSGKRPSPFDRAIVLGWYDGPTDGLIRCGACGRVYQFEYVDSIDEDRGLRLYSLAPVPSDAMDRLVDELSPFLTPSWPMWAPLWKFPTEEDRDAVEAAVDELMARVGAPEFAIATAGLLDEIDAARAVPADGDKALHDWVSWMGMMPSPAERS